MKIRIDKKFTDEITYTSYVNLTEENVTVTLINKEDREILLVDFIKAAEILAGVNSDE